MTLFYGAWKGLTYYLDRNLLWTTFLLIYTQFKHVVLFPNYVLLGRGRKYKLWQAGNAFHQICQSWERHVGLCVALITVFLPPSFPLSPGFWKSTGHNPQQGGSVFLQLLSHRPTASSVDLHGTVPALRPDSVPPAHLTSPKWCLSGPSNTTYPDRNSVSPLSFISSSDLILVLSKLFSTQH